MTSDDGVLTGSVSQQDEALDGEASVFMKRGIALMAEPDTASSLEAVRCFDQALALRRQLPVDRVPRFGYGLAACLLNRAEALLRLEGPEHIDAAIQDFEASIALLQALPLETDPRYVRRLAIAHQNHGLALYAKNDEPADQAIAAFTAALSVLEQDVASAVEDRHYLMAVVWMNLANALAAPVDGDRTADARAAAVRALALVASIEAADANAAQVGITARHILCRTLANRLSEPAVIDAALMADVHTATDAVDDGLRLVNLWESRGVTRFHDLASDLFRFGVMVYGKYQPQFVDEFVRENT